MLKDNGDIYIADTNNGRVQLWKNGSDTGETVFDNSKIPVSLPKKQFPAAGTNLDQPLKPTDVYVNSNNELYVLDYAFGYVWKLSSNDNVAEILIDNLYADNNFNKGAQGFFVRDDGTIYITIGEEVENKILKWHPSFGDKKARLLIGGSKGDDSKKLNLPNDISFDSKEDLYIADKCNGDHRIQKLKLSKSLVIPAGQTSASLNINIIEDITDENDETVILTPGTVIGANNSNTEALTFTITDDDDPPKISFKLSSEYIEENSPNDIILTAELSIVSGKDIEIPFTVSGTADTSEYVISPESAGVPAGSNSSTIAILTNGIDDSEIEVVETIILNVGTPINASLSNITTATIYLISDDDPDLSSIEVDKAEIYEHEKSLITAKISMLIQKNLRLFLIFQELQPRILIIIIHTVKKVHQRFTPVEME